MGFWNMIDREARMWALDGSVCPVPFGRTEHSVQHYSSNELLRSAGRPLM